MFHDALAAARNEPRLQKKVDHYKRNNAHHRFLKMLRLKTRERRLAATRSEFAAHQEVLDEKQEQMQEGAYLAASNSNKKLFEATEAVLDEF